jgi:hypothetical protein
VSPIKNAFFTPHSRFTVHVSRITSPDAYHFATHDFADSQPAPARSRQNPPLIAKIRRYPPLIAENFFRAPPARFNGF